MANDINRSIAEIQARTEEIRNRDSQATESFISNSRKAAKQINTYLEAQQQQRQAAIAQANYYNMIQQQRLAQAVAEQEKASNYSDYNNGYEFNSLADVLLNWGAMSNGTWGKSVLDYIKRTPIVQIFQGNFSEALNNAMVGLGEDIDAIANVSKSLLMNDFDSEALLSTVGLSQSYGIGNRVNYDWDTGYFLSDMLLETVSDPINVIEFIGTFGTSAVAKAGIKTATKAGAESANKSLIKDLTKEVLKITPPKINFIDDIIPRTLKNTDNIITRSSVKQILNAADGVTADLLSKAEKDVYKQIKSMYTRDLRKTATTLSDVFSDLDYKSIKKYTQLVRETTDLNTTYGKAINRILIGIESDADDMLSNAVSKGISSIYRGANLIDTTMLKIAGTEVGIFPAYKAIKFASNKEWRLTSIATQKTLRKLQKSFDSWDDIRNKAYKNSNLRSIPADYHMATLKMWSEASTGTAEDLAKKLVDDLYSDTRRILNEYADLLYKGKNKQALNKLNNFIKAQNVNSFDDYINILRSEIIFMTKQGYAADIIKACEEQIELINDTWWDLGAVEINKVISKLGVTASNKDIADAIIKDLEEEIITDVDGTADKNIRLLFNTATIDSFAMDLKTMSPEELIERHNELVGMLTNHRTYTATDKLLLQRRLVTYRRMLGILDKTPNVSEANKKIFETVQENLFADLDLLERKLKTFSVILEPEAYNYLETELMLAMDSTLKDSLPHIDNILKVLDTVKLDSAYTRLPVKPKKLSKQTVELINNFEPIYGYKITKDINKTKSIIKNYIPGAENVLMRAWYSLSLENYTYVDLQNILTHIDKAYRFIDLLRTSVTDVEARYLLPKDIFDLISKEVESIQDIIKQVPEKNIIDDTPIKEVTKEIKRNSNKINSDITYMFDRRGRYELRTDIFTEKQRKVSAAFSKEFKKVVDDLDNIILSTEDWTPSELANKLFKNVEEFEYNTAEYNEFKETINDITNRLYTSPKSVTAVDFDNYMTALNTIINYKVYVSTTNDTYTIQQLINIVNPDKKNYFNTQLNNYKKLRATVTQFKPSTIDDVIAKEQIPREQLEVIQVQQSQFYKTKTILDAINITDPNLKTYADKVKQTLTGTKYAYIGNNFYALTNQAILFNNLRKVFSDWFYGEFSVNPVASWVKALSPDDANEVSDYVVDRLCNYYNRSIDSLVGVDTEELIKNIASDLYEYKHISLSTKQIHDLHNLLDESYIIPLYNMHLYDFKFTPSLTELSNTASELAGIIKNNKTFNNLITAGDGIYDPTLNKLTESFHNVFGHLKETDALYKYQTMLQRTLEGKNYIYTNKGFILASELGEIDNLKLESNSWYGYITAKTQGILTGKKITEAFLTKAGANDTLDPKVINNFIIPGVTLTDDLPKLWKLLNKFNTWDIEINEAAFNSMRKDPNFFKGYKDVLPSTIALAKKYNPDFYYNFDRINLDGFNLTEVGYWKFNQWLIDCTAAHIHDLDDTLKYVDIRDNLIIELADNTELSRKQISVLLDSRYLTANKPYFSDDNEITRRLLKIKEDFNPVEINKDTASAMMELVYDIPSSTPLSAVWLGRAQDRLLQVHNELMRSIKTSPSFVETQKLSKLREVKPEAYKKRVHELYNIDEGNRIDRVEKYMTTNKALFRKFLFRNTPGFIYIAPDVQSQIDRIAEFLPKHAIELKNNGIDYAWFDDDSLIIYLTKGADKLEVHPSKLRRMNTVTSTNVPYELGKAYAKGGDIPAHAISGDITSTRLTDRTIVENFYNNLPDRIKNNMLIDPRNMITDSDNFDFSKVSFDNTFYGNLEKLNAIYSTNEYKVNLSYIDKRINLMAGAVVASVNANEAAAIMYTSDYARVSLRTLYADTNLSYKDIAMEFRNHPELIGMYWVKDDKGKYIPKTIKLTDPKAVKLGIETELNPIIMDRASAAYFIKQYNTPKLNYGPGFEVLETLSACLKAGYLSSPGWVVRNVTSTTFKALLDVFESGADITDINEIVDSMQNSIKRINKYHQCYAAISEFGRNNKTLYTSQYGIQITNKLVNDFFESEAGKVWKGFKEDYLFIDNWFKQGYADPITQVLEEQARNGVIKGQGLLDSLRNIDERLAREVDYMFDEAGNLKKEYTEEYAKWVKQYEFHKANTIVRDFAFKNPWTSMLMGSNTTVEAYGRFFTYTWNLEHGRRIDEAAERVRKIHFDYNSTSKTESVLNTVIPFLNFRIDNTKYWLDEIYMHPGLMRMIIHMYKANGYYDTTNEEKVEEDYYVQQLLQGAVPLGNTGLYFKLNPDYIDALQTALNPIEVLTDSVLGLKTIVSYLEYQNKKKDAEQKLNDYAALIKAYRLAEPYMSEEYKKDPNDIMKTYNFYQSSVDYYDKVTKELFLGLIPFYSRFKTNKDMLFNDTQNAFMELLDGSDAKEKLSALSEIYPSLFTQHDKRYYYSYGNLNVSSKDYNKYLDAITEGEAVAGWAGVTQPIQIPKTYYVVTTYNGKSYVTSDPNKAAEWLSSGKYYASNYNARILKAGLDIDKKVYTPILNRYKKIYTPKHYVSNKTLDKLYYSTHPNPRIYPRSYKARGVNTYVSRATYPRTQTRVQTQTQTRTQTRTSTKDLLSYGYYRPASARSIASSKVNPYRGK